MILKTIIDRLNQRIEVSNIFDRIYGLCELTGDKGWIYYIGDGQAIPVTDYDSKQGSLFWAKRGKVNISKIDSLKVSGCKQMYSTKFNLSAYAIVRKSHLPCDGEDAGDWVASRVYKLVSGRDYGFKEVIDVVSYEVIPNGYTVGDKSLPPNLEFATVVIDLEVEIVSGSEDTCYDICNTGDIPLPPDFLPCTPCLTEVAVDGVTITGNGTPADPLVAIGGGTPLRTQDEGVNVSTNTTTLNFTGDGVTASLTSPGVVQVNIPSGGGVTSVSGVAPIASSGGNTPAISIPQATASVDGYLDSADFATFAGKQDALTAGTGISLASNIVTNTAPDQIVSLTGGTGISTSGTYPSFTIDNTAPDQIVSITGGTDISVSGTYPNFTINSTAATGMQGGQATGTDTYAVSIPGVTAYNLNDAYAIGFTNANTGASTLNINGLGAVNIAKNNVVPIIGGDIAANQQFIAIYDGTNFQLLGVAPNQMFAYITNADSVTINRGQPVYAFGATGDRMTVKLANNTSEATSSKTVGLVFSNSIGPNQKGYIITQGVIDGINTNAYAAGDTLYVGNTAGALTNTMPFAPNHLTRIGIVERANAGNGQIYVFVQNGFQLDELSDVDITTTPLANNQFLVYTTGVNNLWKNRTLGNVLGGTTSQYVRGDGSLATLPSATSTPYIEGELIGNAISQNSNCLDILVEPSINRLYVPFFGGNVTYIFNTSTNALVATLSTTGVNAVFYIASVNQLWVTYLASGNISRFNATTGASAGADITGSGNRGQHYIEYSATKVFIANSGSNTVTVVNPATATVTATIATVAAFPRSMVLNTNVASAQNDRIAVVCPNANTMLLINPNTNAITIAAVNVGSQMSTPNSIVYDATSDRYIIGNLGNNRLLYITPTTATSFTYDTYTDAFRPYELNYNSSTRYVYITQPTPANSVFNPTSLALVDAATKQMFKQIVTTSFDATNIGLSVITIDTTNGYIYLVSYGANARIIKIKI